MISIEEFKKYLPKDHSLSEEEILNVRDKMDKMAEIFFTMWLRGRKKKTPN